jgi:4-diphosphocytidyl-2-C-methyl-D-erythritol kinase
MQNRENEITYRVPAKINLFLDITGRREDGYHLVKMLMQTVSLYDRVTVKRSQDRDSMTCSNPDLSTDESNLCRKALQAMKDHFNLDHFYQIHLDKSIPMAAGLAGGSADAAAVIRCLEKLENLETSDRELEELAVGLGADIPYCLHGGSMLSEGIGEILTPVEGLPLNEAVLLIKPPIDVSTRDVYRAYDSCREIRHPDTEFLLNKAEAGSMQSFAQHMGNVLEEVTAPRHPVISELETALRKEGAYGAMMSGSGPTVFGLFASEDKMRAAEETMKSRYPGYEIFGLHFTGRTW